MLTALPQVGNWGRWLSDFIGMDADISAKDGNGTLNDDDKKATEEPKSFPLLNALSDLLMLPKDMLMDRTIRMEVQPNETFLRMISLSCIITDLCTKYSTIVFLQVCPEISLPLVKRVLCNFSPDEFCPDPVPGAVLEALNAEVSVFSIFHTISIQLHSCKRYTS